MDGRLSVDDSVGDYVDGLPPEMAAITLHQLLTHTSGLPDVVGDDYDPVDLDEFVARVVAAGADAEPGADYAYSNVGYSLLAAVIEDVAGQSYDAYLADALFAPAGMDSTGYLLADVADTRVAVGYDGDTPTGRPADHAWATDGPYWNLRGNGGLLSTATDLHRWHVALAGDDILDEASKAAMIERHVAEGDGADTFYGYGWVIAPPGDGHGLVAHNGGNGIFFADMLRFLDDDVLVVVLTNDASSTSEDLAYDIAAVVYGDD